jgi:predicted HicB family RNase H-like nuclease
MKNLNKKIVVRITRRHLEFILEETEKQNKSISQLVRKAITEHLLKING